MAKSREYTKIYFCELREYTKIFLVKLGEYTKIWNRICSILFAKSDSQLLLSKKGGSGIIPRIFRILLSSQRFESTHHFQASRIFWRQRSRRAMPGRSCSR